MPVNKNIIKISFSKAVGSYEKEILIQKKTAFKLLQYSKGLEGLGIDLGCGTGFLSSLIGKDIIGVDISFSMARIYKNKNHRIVVGDIENLPFKDKSFDFAVSNFALHWTDLERSFKEVKRILKEDGRFIFCIPVEGSLKIVEKILGEKNFDFLSVDNVLEILSKYFKVKSFEISTYEEKFKNGLELLKHLHKTGSSIGKSGKTIGEKRKIFNKFNQYKDPCVLNFEVLFVSATNHLF